MTPDEDTTTIATLNLVKARFVSQLPIIILVLGFIGFIGNTFTFLQSNLRSNTFCIYTLCGSLIDIINLFLNLLPNYIFSTDNVLALINNSQACKWKVFGLIFIPQLSMNLLILSLIDRYISTCTLTSPLRKLHQLRAVPYLIGITVIITGIMSLYSSPLYDIMPGFGCVPTNGLLNAVFYIIFHGFVSPFIMLVFIWLTNRNIQLSRQRVGAITNVNIHHTRQQFIKTVVIQVIVTSFLVLQWIVFYIYHVATQFNNKTPGQWAIHYFVFVVTNDIYYLNNVKSFYLSTLTSRLFRETFIRALRKLIGLSVEPPQNTTRLPTLTIAYR